MKSTTATRIAEFISPVPTLLLIVALCAGEPLSAVFILLFAVLLHEGAHLAAMLLLSNGAGRFRGAEGGFLLTGNRPLLPREEAAIAAAGPIANLSAAALCLLFLRLLGFHGWLFSMMTVNLLTALCNLLPLRESDGGRLCCLALSHLFGARGKRMADVLSVLLAGLFFFAAVYLFHLGRVTLSLPLFTTATLLRVTRESSGERQSIWENLREKWSFFPKNGV